MREDAQRCRQTIRAALPNNVYPMIHTLRTVYRKYVHAPWLDHSIYAVLDTATNLYARAKRLVFPKNSIRRWKLNMLWELYEPETCALFRRTIKSGQTVVDIGAH